MKPLCPRANQNQLDYGRTFYFGGVTLGGDFRQNPPSTESPTDNVFVNVRQGVDGGGCIANGRTVIAMFDPDDPSFDKTSDYVVRAKESRFQEGNGYSPGIHIFGIPDGIDVSTGFGKMIIEVRNCYFFRTSLFFHWQLTPGSQVDLASNGFEGYTDRHFTYDFRQWIWGCSSLYFAASYFGEGSTVKVTSNWNLNYNCRHNGKIYQNAPIQVGREQPSLVQRGTGIEILNSTVVVQCSNARCRSHGIFVGGLQLYPNTRL